MIKTDKYAGQPQKLDRVRVASIAVLPDRWQNETNWQRIEILVRRAALQGGAQLVVTPEGALDGYVINDVNAEKDERQKKVLLQHRFAAYARLRKQSTVGVLPSLSESDHL
ncbi:hypothetical protein GX408_10220 [bacterium]|nr:hypothetical protein [bacterium]